MSDTSATVDLLGPGARVGERFVIEAIVASGGMGMVFRVRDTAGPPEALAALKVLARVDEDSRRRFVREAELLAGLRHPAVVRYIGHGETSAGEPWLVMEWLEGPTLADVLKRGPMALPDVLTLARRMAAALAAVHGAGLIHRDVKPANFILPQGDPAQVTLVDFGLARPELRSDPLTRTGAVIGTPTYMAPEQVRAEHELDARVDIFALGSILYECLAGRAPFDKPTLIGVLNAILQSEPLPLSVLRDDVPLALERLLLRMLAKDPDARPAEGGAVALELELLGAGVGEGERVRVRTRERVFAAPPWVLWAFLADSDRWNRIIGSPLPTYHIEAGGAGAAPRRIGSSPVFGLEAVWEEIGEWVEVEGGWGQRRFSAGLFALTESRFRTQPVPERPRATAVWMQVRVTPRPDTLDQAAELLAEHLDARLERYFDAIERFLAGVAHRIPDEPTEPPSLALRRLLLDAGADPVLTGRRAPLDEEGFRRALEALRERTPDRVLMARLAELVREGPDDLIRELRPAECAALWRRPAEAVLEVMLQATAAGLLDLRWELICPTCRVAGEACDTLAAASSAAMCIVCGARFELDLSTNVEVVFAPAQAVRPVRRRPYCIGSPAFRPHILAQLQLAPGERRALGGLDVGEARWVRLLDRPGRLQLDPAQAPLVLTADDGQLHAHPAPPGQAEPVVAINASSRPVALLIERGGAMWTSTTGAALLTDARFGRLFPAELPHEGVELTLSALSLVAVQIDGVAALCAALGDAAALALVRRLRRELAAALESAGGVAQRVGPGALLGRFDRHDAALRALAAARAVPLPDDALSLRVALERGPCLMARLDDSVELFGATVAQALGAR